jgi:hypothetical protein
MTVAGPNTVAGSFAIPAAAPVFTDGIVNGSAAIQAPVFNAAPSQRFWSSPVRKIKDDHDEILIVTLPGPQVINYLSLDLPHFPHTAYAYWQAPGTTAQGNPVWHPVLTKGGVPLVFTVTGSVPAMVNPASALRADVNPYHYGAGHWIHHDEDLTPFYAVSLIITGTRKFAGPGGYPVDPSGHESAYPLGVRSLDFGYRATAATDLPVTNRSPSVVTERLPFAVVTDVLGSPVELAVRENRASDLLQGKSWKCAPQPYSYSVVLLYADARDSGGNPQVIDGIFFDPLTSGVSVNVYYSTAPPPPADGFAAVDTPLSFPVTTVFGAAPPVVGTDGILFPPESGWLAVDNASVQWNPAQPWWAALEIMPQFPSTDTRTYAVADWGVFQLLWNGSQGAWQMTSGGGTMTAQPFAHAINDRIYLVAAWDGQNIIFYVAGGGISAVVSTGDYTASQFQFGGITGQSWPGNYRLRAMVLKQEQVTFAVEGSGVLLPDTITEFVADSVDYVTPSLIPAQDTGTTVNSLMRFTTGFCLGDPLDINPYGFVGGPGDIYESVVWTPAGGEAKLAKGTFQFDPVLASCVKLEFTGLVAQTYNYYAPSVKTVRTMPPGVVGMTPAQPVSVTSVTSPSTSGLTSAQSQAAAMSPAAPVQDTGLSVNQSIAPIISWPDSQPLTPPAPAGAGLPTEALTATDPATAQALSKYGSLYQMQAWQQPPTVPSFTATGQHSYQYVEIIQKSRTAYFAGLSSLALSRVNYTAQHDPARYTDLFLDTANIDPATLIYENPFPQPWSWAPGALTVPFGLPGFAQITSRVFPSTRNITAIQLATQQSDAVQLLFDPDFSDPQFRAWSAIGDSAPLTLSDEFTSTIGEMAEVSRIPSQFTWGLLEDAFASWSAIEATGETWEEIIGSAQSLGYGGMISLGGVPTTSAGRVYAAARVFTTANLTFPLYLQILDAASGAILAEMPQDIQAGIPNEWFVGYTLQPGTVSEETWADVMAADPVWDDLNGTLWENIDQTVQPPGSGMLVQLVQYGISDDTWDVDTLSLYEDSIVWEFSSDGGASFWPAYDIRNNPSGVLVLPPPEGSGLAAGTQLMWRLSGYRPGLQVNSLAIRPWYGSLPGGVRSSIPVAGGPNVNILDHYPPIAGDPRWKTWSSPIPQDWWFAFRQQLALETPQAAPAVTPPAFTLGIAPGGIAIVPPAPEGGTGGPGGTGTGGSVADGPVTFSDVYPDPYNGFYGAPDGGDIYSDLFGNNTYPLSNDPN